MVNDIFDYIKNNDIESVKKIIESNKMFVNIKDKYGHTPLHYSIYIYYLDITIFLLEHGADIKNKNVAGLTPLDYCKDDELKKNIERMFKLNKIYGTNSI